MKWVGCGLLIVMLAAPASRGDDPPKDKEKKEPTLKEQYNDLVKQFSAKQQEILTEARKAKGEEQQKLIEKYRAVGKEFAEKFYQLAADNPKDPVGVDALFWVVENANGSPVYKKAADQVNVLIGELQVKDLTARLNRTRANPALIEAVLKRADKGEKDAGDLVAWAATNGSYLPEGEKAMARLIEKYPDHPRIEQVCMILGRGGVDGAEDLLRKVLAKTESPKVKATATLALGKALAEKTNDLGDKPAELDKVAAEGEKYLAAAIDLYKDNEAQRKDAEQELKVLKTMRVGKEAPDIKGPDLDGKEFKLSDYRGKVVLIDFWGNW